MEIFFYLSIIVVGLIIYYFNEEPVKGIKVADIIYYPIRHCAGIHLFEAEFVENGLKRDGEWAIISPKKTIIDQLDDPRLIKLQPRFEFGLDGEPTNITLTYAGFPDLKVNFHCNHSKEFDFEGFNIKGKGIEAGEEANRWLEMVFERDYRLMKICEKWKTGDDEKNTEENFDKHALYLAEDNALIVGEASFKAILNEIPGFREDDVSLMGFRPNIIVKNVLEFEEDLWIEFKIGEIKLRTLKMCEVGKACIINPRTLDFNKHNDPLNTLRRIHSMRLRAYFGILAQELNNGKIHVKDTVKVVSQKSYD
ncbi:unnamed protein product [Blepharisma stoltei]|uniref:MOSC domain-containing protein n=1 Tax=Blepharisma stoltei TaxID=1481888 RepID=A0AAU9IXK1_9CILI|nr:unnamed protein product [Blepharisma stoltei]